MTCRGLDFAEVKNTTARATWRLNDTGTLVDHPRCSSAERSKPGPREGEIFKQPEKKKRG